MTTEPMAARAEIERLTKESERRRVRGNGYRDEMLALQAIVDKLDKMADGVLAVPGTPYVFVGQWGHVYEGVVETKPYYISKCYSTREAAEAKGN